MAEKKNMKNDSWQSRWRDFNLLMKEDDILSLTLVKTKFPEEFSKDFSIMEVVRSLDLFIMEEPFLGEEKHWLPQNGQLLEHVQYDIKKPATDAMGEAENTKQNPFSNSLLEYISWVL